MIKQKSKSNRVKTGVLGLDEMLGGGLIKGSVFLLSGRAGSGKTSVALQFIREGLETGEKCLYISFVEDPARTLEFYGDLKVDWTTHIKKKDLILAAADLRKISKFKTVLQKYLKSKVSRLVIDGLTPDSDSKIEKELAGVINIIKKQRVSAVLTADVVNEDKYFGLGASRLSALVDGIIVIKQSEVESEILKVLAIIKARGSNYDTKIKELRTGDTGEIEIGGVMEGFKDVLSNTPAASEIGLNISYGRLEDEFIEDFNKKYPNVVIHKSEEFSREDRVSLIAQKNTTLGVCVVFFSQMHKLASEGLLVELDNYIDKELFYEKAISSCTFENKIYGIPDDVYTRCLFYRKDLLKKYGLTVPDTWEKLIECAKYVVKKEKDPELSGLLYFCGEGRELTEGFLEFLWGNGADVFDSAGNVTISSDKAKEAFQLMHDLIYKHNIMPKGVTGYFGVDMQKAFNKGKVLFMKNYSGTLMGLHSGNLPFKNEVGVIPLPKMPGGEKGYSVMGGSCFVVPKNTKYLKSALSFLRFITDIKTARKVELAGGYPFPTRPAFWKDTEILKQKPYYNMARDTLENGRFPYNEITNYDLISLMAYKKIYAALINEKSIGDTLNNLANDIKRLKRHKIYSKFVESVVVFIEANYDKKITLEDIAFTVRLSPNYLAKIFKLETNMTLIDYVIKVRIEKAKELLRNVKLNISEVANMVGYADVPYFCQSFKKQTNQTPTEFRLK
ncbi:MAG: hypothetical protein A2231_00750 [Candidatus Firestonebacteria bacterium RIFOXYA2_FULL_40_8]|nr:MAG: hypothetical protein A2231_00750 [Candidatus Firestonebacteria bacterium RIFOXYA2_FULL_40_8]